MIIVIFCLVNIVIVFFVVKTILSKMRILTKTVIIFPLFIVSFISLMLAMTINGLTYHDMEDRHNRFEDRIVRDKLIYFKNETNQTVSIIINFEYSEKENLKYSFISLYYHHQNKMDTIRNLKKGETVKFITPISTNNPSIPFPEKFNIRIIDSTGKIIKIYDKQNFLKNVDAPEYKNIKDEEIKAMKWTLKIEQNYQRRKFK